MTNRRELLIALGVLVVPLIGRAQQTKVPRLGILGITIPQSVLIRADEAIR